VASFTRVAPQSTTTPPPVDTQIPSLIEFEGDLYGASSDNGRLQVWNGVDAWVLKCGTEGFIGNGTNDRGILQSMIVFDEELYAGNAAALSVAAATGGALLKYNGTNAWEVKALGLSSLQTILCLAEFEGKIFGGGYAGGASAALLSYWNGTDAWVKVAVPLVGTESIYALKVWENELYGATNQGRLYKWNGIAAWTQVGTLYTPGVGSPQTYIYDLVVYRGVLYGAGSPSSGTDPGHLLEYTPGDDWDSVGATNLYGLRKLCVHRGYLFGITVLGQLYIWNGSSAWTQIITDPLDYSQSVYSMYSYNDELYVGTGTGASLFVLTDWTPGGSEEGQTLAVHLEHGSWRSLGYKVNALYYAQDTDQLVAAMPFEGLTSDVVVCEIEVPGQAYNTGLTEFVVETKHVRLNPEQPVQVRWVHIDSDTGGQDLTVTLILDGEEVALGTLNTSDRVRTTFSVNRWGRLAGVRVSGEISEARVTIYGVELDVHKPQESLP